MAKGKTDWVEHARDVLRDSGHRAGGARGSVVELLSRQDCCLTAQQIHDRLHRRGRPIGIASVYRILDLLVAHGLVTRLDVGSGVAHYEPSQAGGEHHHHLVCEDCGKVEAFADEGLERAIRAVQARAGATAHDVVLRGACQTCRS